MEESGIMKAALFKSHYEAAKCISDRDTRLTFLEALFDYQFYGKQAEGLPEIAKALMVGFLPVVDKELEGKGGRPECEASAEEIAAKKEELGSAKAVAEHYGISERTVYAKLQTAKTAKSPFCSDCKKLQTAKTAKTKEERRMKKEERENGEERESRSAQAAPCAGPSLAAEPPAPSLSSSSVAFPTERARAMPPPTREELAALRAEKGYTFDIDAFLAYYGATGWRRRDGARITDWRMEALLWQKRERPQAQARASPEYKTWRADDLPAISDEERAAVAAGLEGIFAKLGGKILKAEARR